MSFTQVFALAFILILAGVSTWFVLRRVAVFRLGERVTNWLRNDESQQGRSFEFEFAAHAIHSGDVQKLHAFDRHMSDHGLNVIDRTVDALRASGYRNLSKRLTSAELGAVETILRGSYAMGVPDANQWGDLLRHAVLHPLDAEAMVQVVRRGIFDIDQVVDMVESFRNNPAPALLDGAL